MVELAKRPRRGGRAIGVDVSETKITEARRRSVGIGPDVSFLVADALALPFEDDAFDICRIETVLQHLAGPGRAVTDMALAASPHWSSGAPWTDRAGGPAGERSWRELIAAIRSEPAKGTDPDSSRESGSCTASPRTMAGSWDAWSMQGSDWRREARQRPETGLAATRLPDETRSHPVAPQALRRASAEAGANGQVDELVVCAPRNPHGCCPFEPAPLVVGEVRCVDHVQDGERPGSRVAPQCRKVATVAPYHLAKQFRQMRVRQAVFEHRA